MPLSPRVFAGFLKTHNPVARIEKRAFNVTMYEGTGLHKPSSVMTLGKISLLLICLWLVPHCLGQGTTTVTFDGQPPGSFVSPVTASTESGMQVTGLQGTGFSLLGGSLSGYPEDGSGYLLLLGGYGIRFGTVPGTYFNFVSFDLAECFTNVSGPVTVQVIGYHPMSQTVTNTFTTDGIMDGTGPLQDFQRFFVDTQFQNIYRVDIAGSPYALDNIVTSGVPEPSPAGLLLVGAICALAWRRLRNMRREVSNQRQIRSLRRMKSHRCTALLTGWLLLIILFAITIAHLSAASYVQGWVQRYPTAAGRKVAVDSDGNVVMAGNFGSLGPGFVVKYSSSGAALWTNSLVGPWGGGAATDVAVGTNGHVYAAGYTYGMATTSDCLIIAYSSSGVPLWTNLYNGSANLDDHAACITVGENGYVYVSGYSRRTPSYRSYVTLAYSDSGTPLWTNLYSADAASSYTDCFAVAQTVDGAGNVYVLGHDDELLQAPAPGYGIVAYSSTGTRLWVNNCHGCISTPFAIAAGQGGNIHVARQPNGGGYRTSAYSSGGAGLWDKDFYAPSPGQAYPDGLAVGFNGNVYVTGHSSGNGTGYDYLTLAYSSAGAPLWTNRYNGPVNANDYPQALAVGRSGNVYVTGYSTGISNSYDYLTLAYSSNGVPVWSKRFSELGGSQAFAMAVDQNDNVYVTGQSGGDAVTIKYMLPPSIQFSAVALLSGSGCRLTVTAPTNINFRLETSTNLVHWLTLTNFTNLSVTSIQYTDDDAPDFPRRFYRAVWTP